MQVAAQLAQLGDYAAMQGQDQRHQYGQQCHPDAAMAIASALTGAPSPTGAAASSWLEPRRDGDPLGRRGCTCGDNRRRAKLPGMSGKRKRKRRWRLAADRLAGALLGSANGNAEVALRRAEAQRDRHRLRARVEEGRRNYGAAARHRHIARRLDRAIMLLNGAGGWLHPADRHRRRDADDLLPRRKGARLRTGRPRSGH